ncbi:cytochrome c oxidase, subunit VIa [Gorgonomyces haynaldii]|nr:cytochrome c oxidase, subunit VIa [Gorgonomyces haynaldii]
MLRIRRFSNAVKQFPSYQETMLPEAYHAKEHAKGSTKMWLNINLFLVIPALAAVGYFTLPKELAHIHHLEEHPNEYVAWPHLRKRKNSFPWGNEALFHNPNSNAVPEE